MTTVALSIGSNINPVTNLMRAIATLRTRFGDMTLSSVYESEAIGFSGANFLNLVALIDVELDIGELNSFLKLIEDQQGRDRQAKKFSGRTLDIDILTFGDFCGVHGGIQLPREEITENAFVLQPLAEILPGQLHPNLHKTYAELWDEYDKSRQKLWKIEFDWEILPSH